MGGVREAKKSFVVGSMESRSPIMASTGQAKGVEGEAWWRR